jgi:hypothetical protein
VQLSVRLVFLVKGFQGKSLCILCVCVHCYSYVLDFVSIAFLAQVYQTLQLVGQDQSL